MKSSASELGLYHQVRVPHWDCSRVGLASEIKISRNDRASSLRKQTSFRGTTTGLTDV